MKTLSFSLILISLLMFNITSCTKNQNNNEKVLNLAITAQVKGMDPIYANDLYSSNEVARVYEGLLEYHYLKRPYTLIPNLAESMPTVSDDGLTYTFKIKKGVFFHNDKCFSNGKEREMIANDFVYSIKRNADPHLQGLGWWVIDGKIKGLNEWREKNSKLDKTNYEEDIEGVKALDQYTLQLKLEKPFPQFLYALAMPFFFVVPKEAVEFYGKEFLNHPVGTGPFILPEFTQTNKIIYTRNPKYRNETYPTEASDEFNSKVYLEDAGKKLPLVDKVIANIITEDQPRWLKLQKGELDFVGIPKDNFSSAVTPNKDLTPDMTKKGLDLVYGPGLDITYIAFNHDNSLFKNENLRKAMSLAYDRNKLNELFYNGMALPAESIVPPGISGYIQGYKNPYHEYNLEKAKKFLADAGYPQGKGLPEIVLDVHSSTTSRQMGEFFKKSMEDIGIKIQVNSNPWPELQKKIRTRSSMMHAVGWGADYPDAENFLQLLYGPNSSPGANGANYNNSTFNEIFAKASVMQDSPERTSLYEKLYKMAAEEIPLIYGVHRMSFVLQQSWLKNYVLTEFTAGQAKYLNVDLDKKKAMADRF